MNPQQTEPVQDSVRAVVPVRVTVLAPFSAILFAMDPAIASMFVHSDMTGQGNRRMTTQVMVVPGLNLTAS
jgi:hypothetical protein